jgi:hypothetical protein
MRLVFELSRDVCGLIGAGLSASAFFRFEGRKAEAASITEEMTDDPDLKAELTKARETLLKVRVLAPNELDLAFTAWGLVLIAISFLISIALTLTEPAQDERTATSTSQTAPAERAAPPSGQSGQLRSTP